MIVMEGLLLVPPERGTIIGRAIWKPRYVIFGTGSTMKAQADTENTPKGSAARKAALKSSSSKPSLVDVSQEGSEDDGLYVAIYKAKGDWELLSQYHISSFKSCEIRALAHRKQSPTIPTLMMETKPDPTSEKARKRRSSRTGGLTTSKDPWAGILLFRTVQEERYNIYDWQVMIKPQLTPESSDDSPISPGGPFHAFTNPFSSQQSRSTPRPERVPQQISSYPHAPRERPSAMISPSPSLRSRRSDLSSQASSQHPPMGFTSTHGQNYSPLPQDLPSPASTSYEPHFNDGWNSTQGRTSALSSHSHTRQSNSIASAIAPTGPIASTPPGPRETILDRAFQMRVIPGSERVSEKDGDKLSSLARFEALMKEDDERKQQKGGPKQSSFSKDTQDWNLDEESEDSDSAEPTLNDDDSDEADGLELELSDDDVGIPATAQQLEYLSGGRRTPIPSNSRPLSPAPNSPPVPFLNPQAMKAFHGIPSNTNGGGLRPRTGTNTSQRTNNSRPSSLIPSRSLSAAEVPRLKDVSVSNSISSTNTNLKASTDGKDKRRSSNSTSAKRLSFQEFARRLSSSTSSLLLVQSNASNSTIGKDGSRRTSAEYDVDDQKSGFRNGGAGEAANRDKRCGWRGSVSAFGEGGYL